MQHLKLFLLASGLFFGTQDILLAQLKNARPVTNSHRPLHSIGPLTTIIQGVPLADPGLAAPLAYHQLRVLERPHSEPVKILSSDERGIPTWMEWKGGIQSDPDPLRWGKIMLAELAGLMQQSTPDMGWDQGRILETNDGSTDISYIQLYKQIPLEGAELRIHLRSLRAPIIQGRYFPAIALKSIVPFVDAAEAIAQGERHIQAKPLPELPAGTIPKLTAPHLVVYMDDVIPRLSWKLDLMANAMHRHTVYIDAFTGEVIKSRLETCSFKHSYLNDDKQEVCKGHAPIEQEEQLLNGPGTANAQDLFGVSRFIHTYEINNTWYLLDGSRPMFNLAASQLPNEPAGAILTINASNTSPDQANFQPFHVTSTDNTWINPAAISAHYNAGKSYEYFLDTLKRNSINGQGGSILSYVNVTETNGSSMDNAFWNGEAIFYGNGASDFLPLARGLDVAAHEMAHGVVQATANLVYEYESGALNESYADIFGAMVDRDDWLIGEDVVKASAFPSGAMRSMSNPHNGGSGLSSPGWQPNHTNEQYKGNQDNGGVHINSGIPNHAFFLFASQGQVGKARAEQVFYRALTNYLVKSSKFLDLRFGVVQACKDLYGAGTPLVMLAEQAFNTVGIGSGFSGGGTPEDYQDVLIENPGQEFLVFTDGNYSQLYLSNPDGSNILDLTLTEPISRPSVTDDGSAVVFIGSDKRMYLVEINYSNGTFTQSVLQSQQIWENVAVAKDGSRIAAITDDGDNYIHVFDFGLQAWQEFELYNPTFSEGVETGEVRYADAMEFDHSGKYIMYDAFNEIQNQNGFSSEYWDIGFLEVWNKGINNFANGDIFKLFSNLPENTSIGNPTFAKNAPYILAFDFLDDANGDISILGTNLETGDVGLIFENNVVGYPNYSNDDKSLVFNATAGFFLDPVLGIIDLETNRIQGKAATADVLIDGGQWGVWFANGKRPLTDIEHPEDVSSMRIYPNPGTNQFFVEGLDQQGQITVLDMMGRAVYSRAAVQAGEAIATSGWSEGMYRIMVTNSKGTYSYAWMLARP